jgi:hypothetical protein
MRTIVRTKSYYSRNNFVCHLEQKQMYWQNKSEQGSVQVIIIVRTRYLYPGQLIILVRTNLHLSNNKNINRGKNIKNERIKK